MSTVLFRFAVTDYYSYNVGVRKNHSVSLFAKIYSFYERIYNKYSFIRMKLSREAGTQDGSRTSADYYLISKKIYSKRFSTDVFSGFFLKKAMRSEVGLNDVSVYESVKASSDELLSQNSYFMNQLYKDGGLNGKE